VGFGKKVALEGVHEHNRHKGRVVSQKAEDGTPLPAEEVAGNLTYAVDEDVTLSGDDDADEDQGTDSSSSRNTDDMIRAASTDSSSSRNTDDMIRAASHGKTIKTRMEPPPPVYDANGELVKMDWSKWAAFTSTQDPSKPLGQASTTQGTEREESSYGSTTEGSGRVAETDLMGFAHGEDAFVKKTTTGAPILGADDTAEKPADLAEPLGEAEANAEAEDLAEEMSGKNIDELSSAVDRLKGEKKDAAAV